MRPAFARRALSPTLGGMDAERSDEALMLAYAAGEAEAFELLYARHRGPLFRFILRQVRVQATAEELYQDVWQKLITARDGYRPEAKFSTWLFQIASNRVTDHWRAAAYRPMASEDDMQRLEQQADPETPEHTLSVFEERRRLQRALEELPADQREVVVLRLEQELSLEEIGLITGVGRETVKSRLRYAMDKLKSRLTGLRDAAPEGKTGTLR
jgi:RNA polymerase sigma-70 factor (ECF subfamily)